MTPAFMTPFVALIRKDLILFLSDRRALLISLLLPIVIGAFFGSVFGGEAKGSAIEVALVLQDGSDAGAKIAAGLKSDPNLHVSAMSLLDAEQAVRKGERKVAIVVPPGFGEAAGSALFSAGDKPAIRLLYDPSQPAVLAMVKGMLTQQVMSVVSAEMFGGPMGQKLTERGLRQLDEQAGSGAGDADSKALRDMLASVQKFQALPKKPGVQAAPAHGLSMPFTTKDEGLSGGPAAQGFNGYAHSFAGMGVQFILFMGVDMGIGILLARRTGVWNRLLAAPVTMPLVLLARAVSAAIIAFALLCAIFAVAMIGFGVHLSSVPGFIGIALCFALLTAGFGLLIAAFGKTPEAARGLAMFATLVMVMLGGAWVPSFVFPEWVQKVTLVVPTRWAIDGLDAVTWRGLGLEAAAPAMAVQLGFAVVFAALALWKFGREAR
jgi:ABC-2 type transport system permease protein